MLALVFSRLALVNLKEVREEKMFKKTKKIIFPLIFQAAVMTIPLQVFAQQTNLVPPETLGKVTDIVVVIRTIIRLILVVAFVAAFVMLLIGGIRWIVAGGDEKGVAGARNMITAALIGLVVVLVAYALIKLVETFFGFNIITGGVNIPSITD